MTTNLIILIGSIFFIFILKRTSKMFSWFSGKKSLPGKKPREKTLGEIKELARILVVDDRESQLTQDLVKEGWKVTYISDLESYSDVHLVDSHVICLDILGVGEKLRCVSGMGLVKGIKEKYPSKKILLYSSVRDHDIFNESLEFVDKRIFKDGQPYQLIKGVEDLAKEAFIWKKCVEAIFEKFKSDFGNEMSVSEFEEKMASCITEDNSISTESIVNATSCGSKLALVIAEYLKVATKE